MDVRRAPRFPGRAEDGSSRYDGSMLDPNSALLAPIQGFLPEIGGRLVTQAKIEACRLVTQAEFEVAHARIEALRLVTQAKIEDIRAGTETGGLAIHEAEKEARRLVSEAEIAGIQAGIEAMQLVSDAENAAMEARTRRWMIAGPIVAAGLVALLILLSRHL